ncbi:hypothetical protein LTR56_020941 [Elasticomyces elasticus]|nr:hypothetical protein LTR56_020941 [Elasticomyces elasticus]KAK4909841.1 hypothetical protein LTR49_021439 [Elasticomyces elasticus]KAK5749732.1 hypothetical protein LTS12_020230 [Elasticomyces elasticus]
MAEDDPSTSFDDHLHRYPLGDGPLSIRLVEIEPLPENESDAESRIVLRMHVVDLSQLLPGESAEPTGRPSVRIDEEVRWPDEYFEVERSCIQQPHASQQTSSRGRGRLSRLVAKLKLKPKPVSDLVPCHTIPEGEPMVRNRFQWGNYVAMSYSWGRKERWEMTDEEWEVAKEEEEKRREAREKRDKWREYLRDGFTMDDDDEDRPREENHQVELDGKLISVRYNLWAALLVFRNMAPFKDGMWLWIDALCVNQQRTEAGRIDRKRQLPLMPFIYRRAGNVIIHVGGGCRGTWGTLDTFDILQDISAHYRTEYYECLDHLGPDVAQVHRYWAEKMLEESAQEWVEACETDLRDPTKQYNCDRVMIRLYDFFDRPYWRRLWIIQELAMAHPSAPVVCGHLVTQWRHVRDAALLLYMMANTVRDAMQRALERKGRTMRNEPSFEHVAAIAELAMAANRAKMPYTEKLIIRQGPGWWMTQTREGSVTNRGGMPLMKTFKGSPIQQSLTLAAGAQCQRAEDRVLGLLALPALSRLPSQNAENFADMSATDIYIEHTKACIEEDHSLDIFSLLMGGGSGPDEGRDMPFWCPEFHIKSRIGRIEGDWHAEPERPKHYPGNLNAIEFEVRFGPRFEGEIMICPGWVVDTVDGLGAMSASDAPSFTPGKLFRMDAVQPRYQRYWPGTKQEIQNQIWSTFVGGTARHGEKAPQSFSCLLDSFPESWPSNDGFLYKRNWDFLQANRDLPIAGKPLSSYLNFQPLDKFDNLPTSNPADHNVTDAHRAMEARTPFRRLMTTSNRPLMGLAPACAQQGDVVIVLAYHSRPLIAMACISHDDSEDNEDAEITGFVLRGEAFIPAIMNGELAEGFKETAMYEFKFT